MPTTLNRNAYLKLLDEDRAWLARQPSSLERDHVLALVEAEIRNPLHLAHAHAEGRRAGEAK